MFFFYVCRAELSINIYREGAHSGTASSSYGTPSEDYHSGVSSTPTPLAIGESASPSTDLQTVNRHSFGKEKCIEIVVTQLEMGVIQRTYDLKVSLK